MTSHSKLDPTTMTGPLLESHAQEQSGGPISHSKLVQGGSTTVGGEAAQTNETRSRSGRGGADRSRPAGDLCSSPAVTLG